VSKVHSVQQTQLDLAGTEETIVRKIVVIMQTTLDTRIATEKGVFWEPFPYGDPEVAYANRYFRGVDTWALSRVLYENIVPWWDMVASGNLPPDAPEISPPFAEFAALQRDMTKVVFSRTLAADESRVVISGDLAGQLAEMKRQSGGGIVVSAGPDTLGPILSTPGLVDELVLSVHPKVLSAGPRLFDGLTRDLTLDLVHTERFDGGVVISHHRVVD
jgi:dihydrofolate reductase